MANGGDDWKGYVFVFYRLSFYYRLEKNGRTRLIWNGCWASDGNGFYTVGRDKQLIKWCRKENEWIRSSSVQFKEAVTAVDAADDGLIIVGTERLYCRLYRNCKLQG